MKKTVMMAVILLGSGVASAYAWTSKPLNDADLSKVRGGQSSGYCRQQSFNTCINPMGATVPSACETCNSPSQQTLAAGTFYPAPAACNNTAAAYFNTANTTCDMTGTVVNNHSCITGTVQCNWQVNCTAGGITQDMSCAAGAMGKCTVPAPPVVVPGSNGNLVTRTACRSCSTGAPTGAGITTINSGYCQAPNP